jgi:flagellar FliL protein
MSDSDDIFDGGESQEAEGGSKKRGGGGLGNLLPTIFKFVAIGLGALIFIVTVSVITYNIMNRGGRSQTVVGDPSSPYEGRRPIFSHYTGIGTITVRTRDVVPSTVTVEVIIGYDLNDQAASMEFINRQHALRDFMRRYFSSKTAAELAPEREEQLKREIREQLNTRFLDTARAREILFTRFDLMRTDF